MVEIDDDNPATEIGRPVGRIRGSIASRGVSLMAVIGIAATAAACVAPARRVVVVEPEPVRVAAGVKRIAPDGEGGLILPDGARVALDANGGFELPNGAHVRRDGSGALNLPNGARCLPDRAGGFVCP